jgi:hypothetical protein
MEETLNATKRRNLIEEYENKEAGKTVNDPSTNEDAKEGGNSNDKEKEMTEEAKDGGEEKRDSELRKNEDDSLQVEKEIDYILTVKMFTACCVGLL